MVKTRALNLVSQSSSPTSVRAFLSFPCLTLMPWSSLSSTPSNEAVSHRILWRGCKAVGPGGPGSISLRLFQALVSHYYCGKPERVTKNSYGDINQNRVKISIFMLGTESCMKF